MAGQDGEFIPGGEVRTWGVLAAADDHGAAGDGDWPTLLIRLPK
ncbi:hypothetical protein [Amycolatopsis sp. NPDC004625]